MRTIGRVVLILAFVAGEFLQAQISSADIHGTVRDLDGIVVANASVSIRNIETGLENQALADNEGAYRFLLLSPGTYELRIEAAGFAIQTRRPIPLMLGQSLHLNIELTSAALAQEIVVVGQLPLLEPERTYQAEVMTEVDIANLPTDSRSYLDLSLLTPGVTNANALIDFTLPQAPDSGLAFAGQSGRSNSVTIDGVDNSDNAAEGVRSTLSQDAVQQFQINRSNYPAEFGGAAGGLINILSRSGNSNVSGTIFAFLRDQSFSARNRFALGVGGTRVDPPLSRFRSGFSIGGPILGNRSFFFFSYQGLRQRESNYSAILASEESFQPTLSQQAVTAALRGSPDPSLQSLGDALEAVLTTSEATHPDTVRLLRTNGGVFPFRNNENWASMRLDHRISPNNQVFARVSFSDMDTARASSHGLKGASRAANLQVQDVGFIFGHSHFVDTNRANEFRFRFAHRSFDAFPADPFGPELNLNGTALLGRDFFLPSSRNEQRFQWGDNFTWVLGKHELKFGGDFHYLSLDTQSDASFGSRFIFGEVVGLDSVIDDVGGDGSSQAVASGLVGLGRGDLVPALSEPVTALQAFNLGMPLAYQQGFGDSDSEWKNKLVATYVQDNFRMGPNLTVNIGLRYELEPQPDPLNRDTNNLAPRVGFAYSPNPRTVIRGGYGIYYASVNQAVAFIERMPIGRQMSQLFVPLAGLPNLGIAATAPQVWALLKQQGIIGTRQISEADVAPLGLSVSATPAVLLSTASNLVNPYSQQVSLNFEGDLGREFVASVGYLMNKGSKLLRSRNTNLRINGSNGLGPTFAPIDPTLLQNNQVESSGSSIYHGMTAVVRKRFSDFYQIQGAYTWSKAIDDTTDSITELQPANQSDLAAERSLSAFDQRHRFVLSGVFASPFERGFGLGKILADLSVAPIVTLASGRPFNLLLGFDANQDTNPNTDRPPMAGRNTGRGPGFASVDLRVTKAFELGRDGDYRLEAIGEVFNLFNSANYSGVNNIVGATLASYNVEGVRSRLPGEPLGFTSAFAPRQIQLGLKFRF